MVAVAEFVAGLIGFLADLVTLVLGIAGVYGLIYHRREFKAFFRLLASSHLQERVKRIKETLGKLEGLDFNEKQDRREIFALLGQVSGQIKPLAREGTSLGRIYAEIQTLLREDEKLSEPRKRHVVYELHGCLDDETFVASCLIVEQSHER